MYDIIVRRIGAFFMTKILLFPLVLFCIVLMAIGSICVGYSFVTIVLHNNYIEYRADVVKKPSEENKDSIVLEYNVEGQTYQSSFPFLEKLVGKRLTIGYDKDDPSRFHIGDQKSHFAMFVWGMFFLMFGLVLTFSMKRFRHN